MPSHQSRLAAIDRLVSELPPGPNKEYLDKVDFTSPTPPTHIAHELSQAVGSLKPDSSPGLPFGYEFAENAEMLEKLSSDALVQLCWERICALYNEECAGMSSYELVSHGCAGVVRFFVKNELHTAEKVKQGRMRLIAVLDVVDQVIERWLHGGQNRANINTWESIPVKPGMGLHDKGLDHLGETIASMSCAVGSDVSGFDFQVREWNLLDDCSVRVALAGCTPQNAYGRLTKNRVHCLARSVIILSDGLAFAQTLPGIQKSGSYNTSSTNSNIRAMLAYMAGSASAITMGDDCVEDMANSSPPEGTDGAPVTDAVWEHWEANPVGERWYERYFPLKETQCGEISFCSFEFTPLHDSWGRVDCVRIRNERVFKQLATLLTKRPQGPAEREELLAAFLYGIRRGVTGWSGRSHWLPDKYMGFHSDERSLREALSHWGWAVGNNIQNASPQE